MWRKGWAGERGVEVNLCNACGASSRDVETRGVTRRFFFARRDGVQARVVVRVVSSTLSQREREGDEGELVDTVRLLLSIRSREVRTRERRQGAVQKIVRVSRVSRAQGNAKATHETDWKSTERRGDERDRWAHRVQATV